VLHGRAGGAAEDGASRAAGGNDARAELLSEAEACGRRGELDKAEALLGRLLSHEPKHSPALAALAEIAERRGNLRAAADLLRRALAGDAGHAGLLNRLGILLARLGDAQQAARAFQRALALAPEDAETHANLGTWHHANGDIAASVKAYRRALAIEPRHLSARLNLGHTIRKAVPPWHFPMMNDARRNALYDEAIRRLVAGRSVLDIGTGAGLLAMMAARAGARWVASCEAEAWIAAKAREVVALNGLGDRIKLIAKPSTALKVGRDLRERAEVLVTEIFGTTCINEHVIPTVEHAHAELLQPGAIVVPRRATVRGYLAGGPALEGYFHVESAAGFTLAPFNEFAQPMMGLPLNHVPHEVLSEDFDLFSFDLAQRRFPAEERAIEIRTARPGRCFGIVQWLRLELAEGIVYENRPSPAAIIDSWGQMLHAFAKPMVFAAGELVRLLAAHNRQHLLVFELPL
jgi:tetratricopeptide (TPR) repeat protein